MTLLMSSRVDDPNFDGSRLWVRGGKLLEDPWGCCCPGIFCGCLECPADTVIPNAVTLQVAGSYENPLSPLVQRPDIYTDCDCSSAIDGTYILQKVFDDQIGCLWRFEKLVFPDPNRPPGTLSCFGGDQFGNNTATHITYEVAWNCNIPWAGDGTGNPIGWAARLDMTYNVDPVTLDPTAATKGSNVCVHFRQEDVKCPPGAGEREWWENQQAGDPMACGTGDADNPCNIWSLAPPPPPLIFRIWV